MLESQVAKMGRPNTEQKLDMAFALYGVASDLMETAVALFRQLRPG
jgi:hypothetical protein